MTTISSSGYPGNKQESAVEPTRSEMVCSKDVGSENISTILVKTA